MPSMTTRPPTRAPWAIILLAASAAAASARAAAPVQLTVGVDRPGQRISPRLVGIFFEDINFGADGGLSAELVKNGSFEFPQSLMGWREQRPEGAAEGALRVLNDAPRSAANPNFLRLQVRGRSGGVGAANDGFRGIGVHEGKEYRFSAWMRSASPRRATLRVRLASPSGDELAAQRIEVSGTDWKETTATLTPTRTEAKASLELVLADRGEVDVDAVSLCPVDTWKARPRGLRRDLVELLADLKPAFLRFPGGCIVEGSQLKYRYQWKATLGDPIERRLLFNRWNSEFAHRPAPDYYQSFAVGFFEYFQLAEDIGAEPLPILNCGMACQFNTGELVPMEELGPYIQDALDLIEFANGPTTSVWGAKRAAMGHPEPFGMKLLGVGNEQWDAPYFERYEAFAKVLKERRPEIEIVSGAGPFPSDQRFRDAWARLRELNADIVDEHSYAMPDWFLRSATRYDGYDRRGPNVFMGEYAAQSVAIASPDNRNNLLCALAEAAFLTGIERNSDVVTMSAYAPLFGHEEAWQWRPNLIWFDNLTSYATPNYYVQQLFSRRRGDVMLPVEMKDERPQKAPGGRIGLGAYQTSVEFNDLRVARGGETLFAGQSLRGPEDAMRIGGRWSVEDGLVRQADPRAATRIGFGDFDWTDCEITLKARKRAGREGFIVVFRNSEGGSYIQWNVGGWGNTQHALQVYLAAHSEDGQIVDGRPGAIQADRWYDVKIEIAGPRVRCFLDGELIHDVEIPDPELPRLYAAASRDDASGDVILKMVNPTGDETAVDVSLTGAGTVARQATEVTLSGAPNDENSIAHPQNVVPRSATVEMAGPQFTRVLPPYSFTVLQVGVGRLRNSE
jgi:alpha-L-arabinofuranosidase